MNKEVKKTGEVIDGCLAMHKLSQAKLINYIEYHLVNSMELKRLNYKELDKGCLFDDISEVTEDLLFENANKYDISMILENNYDNAVVGTLGGYNPKTKRAYLVTDDYYYTTKLKELSLTELRYLAIQIAVYLKGVK